MSSVIRMRAITTPRTCDCGCGVTIHPSSKPWEGDCDGEKLSFIDLDHYLGYLEAVKAAGERAAPSVFDVVRTNPVAPAVVADQSPAAVFAALQASLAASAAARPAGPRITLAKNRNRRGLR